ncbi:hypothetical protein [Photobacterium sp. TLY01]|uniref:hypothetical protein n=1 Tax=Photobacterium sp. TLY01 TaxID=2907534 RepID=UPI001F2F6A38|nr:hypothetical protein [Photobacterium sp. TLY01]UIP28913.1 hypothetical protein LN341_05375 [Photobacterium sp. TLY01]
MEDRINNATHALNGISNTLCILTEHIESNSFEYSLIELLADYASLKAKQINAKTSSFDAEPVVSEEEKITRYA